jgi:hypothetical protein
MTQEAYNKLYDTFLMAYMELQEIDNTEVITQDAIKRLAGKMSKLDDVIYFEVSKEIDK